MNATRRGIAPQVVRRHGRRYGLYGITTPDAIAPAVTSTLPEEVVRGV
jgi:hypothetical protein